MYRSRTHNYVLYVLVLTILTLFCKDNLESSDRETQNTVTKTKYRTTLPETMPGFENEKEKLDFIQGRFKADRYLSPYFNPGGDKRQHFLLPSALNQYKKMVQAFDEYRKKNHPSNKQSIFIVSSFRDFYLQKHIWEKKFTGKTKMREPIQGKSPEQIIDIILQFSSAPGTSRHHWGTDFDINSLQNSYFEKGGKGEIIYQWMTQNAHKFGFCQPYNELEKRDGKGYYEEKWHWSYKPISSKLRNEWIQAHQTGKISNIGYLGSDSMKDRPIIYVSSVNEDCK